MMPEHSWSDTVVPESASPRANKLIELIEKQVDADADELEREIDAAAREGAA
jgi:hypothetical protein